MRWFRLLAASSCATVLLTPPNPLQVPPPSVLNSHISLLWSTDTTAIPLNGPMSLSVLLDSVLTRSPRVLAVVLSSAMLGSVLFVAIGAIDHWTTNCWLCVGAWLRDVLDCEMICVPNWSCALFGTCWFCINCIYERLCVKYVTWFAWNECICMSWIFTIL